MALSLCQGSAFWEGSPWEGGAQGLYLESSRVCVVTLGGCDAGGLRRPVL